VKFLGLRQRFMGKTKRSFSTRLHEHQADVRKNRKQSTALAQHAVQFEHKNGMGQFENLGLGKQLAQKKIY